MRDIRPTKIKPAGYVRCGNHPRGMEMYHASAADARACYAVKWDQRLLDDCTDAVRIDGTYYDTSDLIPGH